MSTIGGVGIRGVDIGTPGAAAVSDPTATVQSGYLGWEIDVFANWEITSDLFWTTRYGLFFPGQAFEDRTTRTFLLVGVTWSF